MKKSKQPALSVEQLVAIFNMAVTHHQQGNLSQAESLYQQLLSVQPKHTDSLHLLGVLYIQAGKPKDAVTLIRKAIKLSPDTDIFYCNLGSAFQAQQLFKEAEEAFNRALALNPKHVQSLYNKGNLYLDQENYAKALDIYEQVLKLCPDHVDALNNIGNCYKSLGDFTKAEAFYSQAIEKQPTCAEAHINLGQLYYHQGKMDDALVHFKDSQIQHPDNVDIVAELALVLVGVEKFDEAEECIARVLSRVPDHPIALCANGDFFMRQGDNEKAKQNFLKAIEVDSGYYLPYSKMGLLIESQPGGDSAEALSYFEKAQNLNPEDPENLCNMGISYQRLERYEESIAALEQSIKRNPRGSEAYINLGKTYLQQCAYDKALECYEQALDMAPNKSVEHNIGIIYQRKGQLDMAKQYFEQALQKGSHSTLNTPFALVALRLLQGDFSAFAEYDKRFDEAECPRRPFDYTIWEGESLEGKHLFLTSDQGIGDEIMFASMVPEILKKAKHVSLECCPRLVPLFERSFPDLHAVFPRSLPPCDRIAKESIDMQCPLASITHRVYESFDAFPDHQGYLIPDPQQVEAFRQKYAALGPGKKIGISWHTSNNWTGSMRRVSLQQLENVLACQGGHFINVQYGDHNEEIAAFTEQTGISIYQDAEVDSMQNLDQFAAQIAALDLVISIDNSTVHFAGALGIPAWVLLPYDPDWRWMLEQEESPWYPSVRLFRQDAVNEWDTVLSRLAEALELFNKS